MKALIILALCAPPDSLVLAVSGASAMEDLDESQMEMYQHLESNPVDINIASRSALLSCGLFTQYQAVSLIEYRSQWGDILSLAELAAVNGFSESFVRAVAPYVSLRSRAPAGSSSAAMERQGAASARACLTPSGLCVEKLESDFFRLSGMSRGWVLPASNLLILTGMYNAGKTAEAKMIARRYCDACAKWGISMLLDPIRGTRNGFACSWSANTFLVLADIACNL